MRRWRRIGRGQQDRRRQRGVALAMALFALATLLVTASSGLLMGISSIRATRDFRGASQVHFVAESAISQALQVINGPGVVHLQNDVVTPWGAIYGGGVRPFPALGGFSYTVTPVASAGDPANTGRLIATANGIEGVRNIVVASVVRSDIPSTSPGAIYLATDDPTNATFNGNAFLIDGNDHNYTGGAGPAPPIPGISTRNDTNTQEAINSLNSQQSSDVLGLGYETGPPLVPSVKTSPAAPTIAQVNQIIDDLLARPGVVVRTESDVTGNEIFGTIAAPKITYFSNASGVSIRANGTADGAGIMIVEGDLEIKGDLNFKGLILVRGRTRVTELTGNATIYGSLWTSDINLHVGGTAIAYYSTQALALANQVSGGAALPAPLRVTQLADCAQLPAGSGGCP